MVQVKPLTASEIRDFDGSNLYVLNTSDRSGNGSRSQLLMTVPIKGTPKTVVIHNTWIPLDLTSQIPDVDTIKDSEDFHYHVRKKNIVVISTDTAEEALKSREAQQEYNRIYDIKNIEAYTEDTDLIDLNMHQASGNKNKPNKLQASPKVLNIVNKEGLTENNRLAALKNIRSELRSDDYRYIINQPKTDDNEKIKQWATNQLNGL